VAEAMSAMLSAVVKKMNHEPITFLKRRFAEEAEDAGALHIGDVRRLFNLDGDAYDEAHPGRNCPGPVKRKRGCLGKPSQICSQARKAE
jgi:glutamyl-tRNA reductase